MSDFIALYRGRTVSEAELVAVSAETNVPPLIVKPAPGTTPEQARDIRARVWAFVFECASKRAAVRTAQDDVERRSSAISATKKYSG